jgi:predicted RNA-binding protein with EMAP domain
MNGLQLIGEFLESHSQDAVENLKNYSRKYLEAWLSEPRLNSNTLSRVEVYKIKDVNLAIDILISVGIGPCWEQGGTVYCQCTQCE